MRTKTYTFLFLISFFLSACTTVYIPPEVNVPIFREAHTFSGGLSYGLCGTNLQSGFSFTKHIALIAGGSYLNRKDNDYEDFQKYIEFGAGYFRNLNKAKSISFEVFGGIGFAHARSKDVKFDVTESGDYYKVFIQPDISFSFGWVDLDAAIKMSSLNFTSYSLEGGKPVTGEPSAFGFETVFTLRLGGPNFKFKYQLGTSGMNYSSGPHFGRLTIINSIGAVVMF